jgi:hypothetical protein
MSAIGQEGAPNGTSAEQQAAGNQPTFDYERGYQELRPEFTRATQELSSTRDRLSEYEQLFEALHDPDPQVQSAAMEALGLELDTGSQGTQEEFVDPLEQQLAAATQRLERLESARELETSERDSQELVSLRDEFIGEAIGVIENKLNTKFKAREEEALGNLAIAMPDAQGVPNVEAAYNLLYGNEGVLEINREGWIDSKLGASQAPLGTSIPADQRPNTAKERIAYIDERMARLSQQQ